VRRLVPALVAAACLVLGAGCAEPVAGYREAASQAVESELGSAQTVQIAVSAWLGGKLTDPTAGVLVDDANRAISGAADSFGGIVPPQGARGLRPEVTDALTGLADAVADARIAVHRNDRPAARVAMADLDDAVEQAERLAVRLR